MYSVDTGFWMTGYLGKKMGKKQKIGNNNDCYFNMKKHIF